jgi:hypothetical protein
MTLLLLSCVIVMIDFYVQDGLSDVPSAPPIHAYDQEISQVSQNVDANVCDGSTVKKEEYNER